MLAMRTEVLDLPFRDPFRIARIEDSEAARTVIVALAPNGPTTGVGTDAAPGPTTDAATDAAIGLGEAFPLPYYGETPETVMVVLPRLLSALEALGPLPADQAAVLAWLERAGGLMTDAMGNHGAAKAGLDMALHDIAGKALGMPVWRLIGTSDQLPPTDYSLGLDEPTLVAERARRVAHFPALKIKVGGPADIATLEAVREVYGGPLRVDANTGWQPDEAVAVIPELARLGVELVEQPFPAHDLPQLRWLRERSSLPIMADESAVFESDLAMLDGVVDGIVVKIAKCGGIGPGMRMIRRARALGMKVMLGCQVETSLGIAAAATLASEVDWVDLDGNLLVADDPFEGLELGADCRWQLPARPGLGVVRKSVDRPDPGVQRA